MLKNLWGQPSEAECGFGHSVVVRVIRKINEKENCEGGNRQCNMENVLKGHIVPSPKNENGYPSIYRSHINSTCRLMDRIHITVLCVTKDIYI